MLSSILTFWKHQKLFLKHDILSIQLQDDYIVTDTIISNTTIIFLLQDDDDMDSPPIISGLISEKDEEKLPDFRIL
jgi:hypothetical protein